MSHFIVTKIQYVKWKGQLLQNYSKESYDSNTLSFAYM
jgi:hypothetical protein